MLESIFSFLDHLNDFLWSYLACTFIIVLGLFFSLKTRFFQIRQFPAFVKTFICFLKKEEDSGHGIHPIKAFFASIGGCIGIGNVVGICIAIQIGGPGAIFWTWIAALLGSLLKYSEVFLGVLHRRKNNRGGYDGGPMYFLPKAFKVYWIAGSISTLLCIYGVEIYQFRVLTESIVTNWHIDKMAVIAILLIMIIAAGAGGVKAVGKICSAIMPFFLVLYVCMSVWVILQHASLIPQVLGLIFSSAFTGHAAIGGFVGSTALMTLAQGVRIGCYSGDIGIGYASVIQSESSTPHPEKQAGLTILGIFLDTFVICSLSVMLILVTGLWKEPIDSTLLVQTALAQYYDFRIFDTPAFTIFMPFFLFLLGYSTIIAYFCVGLKCARFLSPKFGQPLYYGYAIFAFIFFSFFDLTQAYAIMTLAGGLLLIFNLTGTYLLRREIQFVTDSEDYFRYNNKQM